MGARMRGVVVGAFFVLATCPIPSLALADSSSAADPSTRESAGNEGRSDPYAFVCRSDRIWGARNEKQRLRLLVSAEGVRVLPLPPDTFRWKWELSLLRHGGERDFGRSGSPFVEARDDRADLLRGSLREWYRNAPEGIEHGLEIPDGPKGPLYLRFDYALEGDLTPKVSEDGRQVVFRGRAGRTALTLLDLRGQDAEGREVAARWEWVEHPADSPPVLHLTLRGSEAAYPVRVLERLATSKGATRKDRIGRGAARTAALAPPVNDLCAGAEVVPGGGPFPLLSSVADLTDATTVNDPPLPSCQSSLSRSVWFAFTPDATAGYSFSLCSDAPTATTVEDTVLAVYASSGSCTGLSEMAGGCSDDACGPTGLQSSLDGLTLSAGTTYYIVAWIYGSAAPIVGEESVQLRVDRNVPAGPPPPNDRCGGAEVIPGAGPFPYLTSVTADIGGATTVGDPAAPSCQPYVSRSIWYSFAPVESGRYTFSTCADAPTATTADDTVLAVFAASAPCSGLTEVAGGCDDDSCTVESAQSVLSGINMTAGASYDIVVWQYGTAAPSPGNTTVQLRVSRVVAPPNDTCSGAADLPLDGPVHGTTVSAFDDTRLASGPGCFAGVGQTSSTASGRDVVYRFTAPDAGRYSFRSSGFDSSKDAVLYVASDCPAGGAPAVVTGCLGAANRTSNSPEEVACVLLDAGQSVYVYVDEDDPTSGSDFSLEATRCAIEAEPNEGPSSATEMGCGLEGSIAPAGDVDFFSLGIPEAGSRLFALADGVAANSTDFDLRVTTGTDTLEYDDFNNDVPFGAVAPNVAGTPLTGTPVYLRVSHYSPLAQAEPYRLYATLQAPAAAATPEQEPNDSVPGATGAANEYYAGALSATSDVDIFSFQGFAGELVQIGLDLDPTRDNTPFNGSLALLDSAGATLLLVSDPSSSSSSASGSGTLSAATPYSPGEGMVYRVRVTGTYYARVAWSSGIPGDYLLSISHDCRILPATDLAVTQTCAPDPVSPGGTVGCEVVVRNAGPHPASAVSLQDDPAAGSTFVSASATQGACAGAAPVVCRLGTLAPGASTTVDVVVTAPPSPGPITNQVRVSTAVVDTDPANDTSSVTVTVGAADSDGDGVPDGADCAPADGSTWAVPGEAVGLVFPSQGDGGLVQWTAPSSPGGTTVLYDLVRGTAASDFQDAICLASGTLDTSAGDASLPGAVFYYLVRAANRCGGTLGTRSDGTPRTGRSCP